MGLLGPNGAGKSTTFNILTSLISKTSGSVRMKDIEVNKLKPCDYLKMANIYCSLKSGYISKYCQIDDYNWLNPENLKICIDGLENLNLSENMDCEYYVDIENLPELNARRIIGYIDCVDNLNIYEFKCVEKLDNEHYIQLAIYAYLYETKMRQKYKGYVAIKNYYLYNILTGELQKINSEYENLVQMMRELIKYKYDNKKYNISWFNIRNFSCLNSIIF